MELSQEQAANVKPTYKIVITKRFPERKQEREYQTVAESGNERDQGKIYDYVTYECFEMVERNIFQQETDDLDLTAVILAVNHLEDNR